MRTDAVIQIPASISSVQQAAEVLANFLTRHAPTGHSNGRGTMLLTGAGISTPSGIPDYRGAGGTYIVNKTYRPIFFNEFRERHKFRQRYWARSFLGYPPVARARPNAIHSACADLLKKDYVNAFVTQNVDGLHTYSHPELTGRTTEIHGSLHRVVCLTCHTITHRQEVQDDMARLNPAWAQLAATLPVRRTDSGAQELKTNPDGDVDLPASSGVTYETFRYPVCKTSGVLKPSVVFFGESVPVANREAADTAQESANSMLCVGTSLAVYSSFRFIKACRQQGKPVAILNQGHVRDEEKWISEAKGDIRINMDAIEVLPLALNLIES
ncbi:DHS-like NAD/FAD-binding domain-containing protein [Protomyces lactucae-debilis]|uniref:DHS-like NAD/FAD-binding domain-containing protein n=1 Tax=Protomyces lactucae-debilis TaxID=2754530 RepID=A0A1Y2F6G8_PROLT|nr:DHS-like NAD/FAD-binding domain-containing protein [Protomyces lactucae-debilis]ORY79500.1 DHS-like NAD/FAD-binding domain-containing protein [Protomyces lactucae-debilis]